MENWIKISDKMPQRKEQCIFYDEEDGGSIHIGCYGFGAKDKWWSDNCECYCDEVTHWIPLPVAPKK